jgi:hypothetical protein
MSRQDSRTVGTHFPASLSSSQAIMRRMAAMRPAELKNMCSVRHKPMPSAPFDRAMRASSGVSALVCRKGNGFGGKGAQRSCSCAWLGHTLFIIGTSRMHVVLIGMQNRMPGPRQGHMLETRQPLSAHLGRQV